MASSAVAERKPPPIGGLSRGLASLAQNNQNMTNVRDISDGQDKLARTLSQIRELESKKTDNGQPQNNGEVNQTSPNNNTQAQAPVSQPQNTQDTQGASGSNNDNRVNNINDSSNTSAANNNPKNNNGATSEDKGAIEQLINLLKSIAQQIEGKLKDLMESGDKGDKQQNVSNNNKPVEVKDIDNKVSDPRSSSEGQPAKNNTNQGSNGQQLGEVGGKSINTTLNELGKPAEDDPKNKQFSANIQQGANQQSNQTIQNLDDFEKQRATV